MIDFGKLNHAQGGLISFNNFLSTSKQKDVALFLAESAAQSIDTYGILFVMSIDPTITSTPFADIAEVSNMPSEDEILFSMHTVFRIEEIKKMNNQSRLFEVHLTLTRDDVEQLRLLADDFDKEINGVTGIMRLGELHIDQGE